MSYGLRLGKVHVRQTRPVSPPTRITPFPTPPKMSGPATSAAASGAASGIFRTLGFATNKEAQAYFTRCVSRWKAGPVYVRETGVSKPPSLTVHRGLKLPISRYDINYT